MDQLFYYSSAWLVLIYIIQQITFYLMYTTVTATVLRVHGCTPRMMFDAPRCSYGVEYVYKGKTYTSMLNGSGYGYQNKHRLKVGDKIEVTFQSSDPGTLEWAAY